MTLHNRRARLKHVLHRVEQDYNRKARLDVQFDDPGVPELDRVQTVQRIADGLAGAHRDALPILLEGLIVQALAFRVSLDERDEPRLDVAA